MKKFIMALLCTLTLFAMSGCDLFAPDAKEFTASGITITLNEDFVLTETVIAPLYLVSLDHIMIGMREEKSLFASTEIENLQDYIDILLEFGGYPNEPTSDSSGDVAYKYAYYSATVDDINYGYMLICAETTNYYYNISFGCLEGDLEDNKDQYIEWSNSLVLE